MSGGAGEFGATGKDAQVVAVEGEDVFGVLLVEVEGEVVCPGVEQEAFLRSEEDLAAELLFEDADLRTDDADAERVHDAFVCFEVW